MITPGAWLQRLAARVCSVDAMERLIAPTIADVQHEYAAARREGRVWRGRWILFRILSFTTISWLAPASNYAYRVALAGRDVPRGINELTTMELRERLAADVVVPVRAGGAGRYVALMYHARASFSCAALVLSLLMLPMVSWHRAGRLVLGAMMCIAYLGYFFWLTDPTAAGRLVILSPAAAAWLPNFLIALAAITWMTSQARWFRGRLVPDRRG